MRIIDIHTHILPDSFIAAAKDGKFGARYVEKDGVPRIEFDTGTKHPCKDVFFDMDARKKDMERQKIDVQGLAVAPALFYYEHPADVGAEVSRLCNDRIHGICSDDPDRFFPVGNVPLQDPNEAIRELRRIHDCYGFKSIQIGTDINGKDIAGNEMIPFYEEVERLKMTILLHPNPYCAYKFLDKYYLSNYLGNTLSTTIGASYLIFSGMLEKFPGLRIVLAHGGGYLPYQIMRLDHGYRERPESGEHISRPPSVYFERNFRFDTVLFNPAQIKALIDLVGIEKVLLGSDYPYDMADHDPYRTAVSLGLSESDFRMITEENAMELFK